MKQIRLLALIALGMAFANPAWSQQYPNHPVKIVVPFAAGSATDIMARILADELRATFGQPFVVENKPGASAQIGAELVAQSPPDGYTLFVTTNTSHSANPFLFKKLNYDPVKDFTPIANVMLIPVIIVVDPKLPIKTLQDLVAYTKANPGKVSFGYGNSIGQVVGASFAKRTGLDVITVPYKSSPQALTDVMGGQLTYSVTDMAAGKSAVQSGKARALGVSSLKRSPIMPELPAMSETPGLDGFEVIAWVAMFAPAKTPKDIVDKLNAVVRTALAKPEVREKIASFAADPAPGSPEDLAKFVNEQLASWGRSIKEAGIQPE
ncbi:MAG: tripartite tricarboxylate transporter substrate binding protein [Burkholderiales bacterium]|nr:tripartite tricarboxylate transporter substrate binding protein [Burkholderiales bacterium]